MFFSITQKTDYEGRSNQEGRSIEENVLLSMLKVMTITMDAAPVQPEKNREEESEEILW